MSNELALLNGNAAPAIRNFQGISEAPYPQETQDVLNGSIDADKVQIKPDGILYYPQVEYRKLLRKAFGGGGWAIRRLDITMKDNVVMFDGELWTLGRYAAGAIGEQDYIPNNGNMSEATAVEGAKSDCLTRCCKDLGIAEELWDPQYIAKWKDEYAVQVWCENVKDGKGKKKLLWRRKDAKPFTYPWKEGNGNQSRQSAPKKATAKAPVKTEAKKAAPAKKGLQPTFEIPQDGSEQAQFATRVRDAVIGVSANVLRHIAKQGKTKSDKVYLIKWYLMLIAKSDKVKAAEMLHNISEWNNTHLTPDGLENASDGRINTVYGKTKDKFEIWLEALEADLMIDEMEETAKGNK